MFAKLIFSASGMLLAGILGLGPKPNTPFLDSLHEENLSPPSRAAAAIDKPATQTNSAAHADDSASGQTVDVVAVESSAGGREADVSASAPVLDANRGAVVETVQLPQNISKPHATIPRLEFTPGVLATFRLVCGHSAELHLGNSAGSFHVVCKHGRHWKSYPVRCVAGPVSWDGRPCVQMANGASLWWNQSGYQLLIP